MHLASRFYSCAKKRKHKKSDPYSDRHRSDCVWNTSYSGNWTSASSASLRKATLLINGPASHSKPHSLICSTISFNVLNSGKFTLSFFILCRYFDLICWNTYKRGWIYEFGSGKIFEFKSSRVWSVFSSLKNSISQRDLWLLWSTQERIWRANVSAFIRAISRQIHQKSLQIFKNLNLTGADCLAPSYMRARICTSHDSIRPRLRFQVGKYLP